MVLIEGERYEEAIKKLDRDVAQKMDGSLGGNPNNDWVLNPFMQNQMVGHIDHWIAVLETRLEP